MVRRRRPRDHLLALHARPRLERVRRRPSGRITVIPNGDRPARPRARGRRPGRAARAVRRAGRAARAAGRPARLREGLPPRAGRARARDRAPARRRASWSPARAPRRRSSSARRAGCAWRGTERSWAGSATTCSTRSTASPTCASCPRSTSRSGWSRSRRWPPAACASSPTPAACARSCPTTAPSGCAFRSRDVGALRGVARAGARRRRRARPAVADAREHVLGFDWAEVARRTARSTRSWRAHERVTREPPPSAHRS